MDLLLLSFHVHLLISFHVFAVFIYFYLISCIDVLNVSVTVSFSFASLDIDPSQQKAFGGFSSDNDPL